jgi:DNA-directed RNA polymerase subunit RPC12/RpoP
MPPFINTGCTNCSKPNRFDLAELRKEGGSLVKGFVFRGEEKDNEEFEVTCQYCGRKFKFTVKGGNNGKT